MAAALPTTRLLPADLLSRIVLQAEEAQAQIERAASAAADSSVISALARRRLQGSRPIMGALRLKRLQLAAIHWRGMGLPS